MILRYDSLSDFLSKVGRIEDRFPGESGHRWDAGVGSGEALRRAVEGDPDIATRATVLLDRIEPVYGEVEMQAWGNALAGPRVDVPAYLGGNPLCMKRRLPRILSGRTVHIYVDLVSSVTLAADSLLKRGVTILALLEGLQRNRVDVELTLVSSGSRGSGGQEELTTIIPVETKPLDLSVVGFCLAHPSFPRNVIYQTQRPHGFHNRLSPGYLSRERDPKGYDAWARIHLEMEPQDVFVPLSFGGDPLIETPEAWVQDRISQICSTSA